MNKKYIGPILAILAVIAAGYVLYVINSDKTLDEPSPLENGLTIPEQQATETPEVSETPVATPEGVTDNMDTMTKAEMDEFMKAVEDAMGNAMEEDEGFPGKVQLLAQGEFLPRFHEVEGQALLIGDDDASVLRFENFETINGPRLHIYLSAGLDNNDYIDLGEIRATKGNVNYAIPAGIDTQKYRYVLVWCEPFGVLFSYAELQS